MRADPPWADYEEVTKALLTRLQFGAPVTTTRLERNVTLQGRSTANQIDILWEFRDSADRLVRLVFECRSHARPINQQALHSWRSVVDDISTDDTATIGVMVTRTGYQAGAQAVAETYGVLILELRAPEARDLEGRLSAIHLSVTLRMPQVRDFRVQAVETLGDELEIAAYLGELYLDDDDGHTTEVMRVLLDGELNSMGEEAAPMHRVVHRFDPPMTLRRNDTPLARVSAIEAMVGEIDADPWEFTVGRLEQVAWMLRNAVTGSRAWFAEDGRVWTTSN